MESINIGLIGFGNIGTGLINALNQNSETISQRAGIPVRITRIADKDITTKRDANYDESILSNDANSLLEDPNIHIIVELVGGTEPARTFVEKALKNGKHVVTANKALLATFGGELFKTAEENNVALLFEASVGGGIPIIRGLQTGLEANNILKVAGILNGTCNYILTNMEQAERAFDDVLKEAQELGFAEPDPTYDIEAYDTAHKTAILASLAFQQDIRFNDVFVEGITKLKPIDLQTANKMGYTIKLLGIAKRDSIEAAVEARVHPTLIPKTSLIGNVHGVFNAVMVEGDLVGKTLFYGRGAGQLPTSSAILSDIMSIAVDMGRGVAPTAEHRLKSVAGEKNLKAIGELDSIYYVRFSGSEKALIDTFAQFGITVKSLEAVESNGESYVIAITERTTESTIQSAMTELEKSGTSGFVLRIEDEI